MRRSRMPVREEIHSSLVSTKVAMSWLERIAGGRHLPQPMMLALGMRAPSRGSICCVQNTRRSPPFHESASADDFAATERSAAGKLR